MYPTKKCRLIGSSVSCIALFAFAATALIIPSHILAQPNAEARCTRIGAPVPNWGGKAAELSFTSKSNPFNRNDLTFVPTSISVALDQKKAVYVGGSVVNSKGALGLFISRHRRADGLPDSSFNVSDTPGYKIQWTGLNTKMPGLEFALMIDNIIARSDRGEADIIATGALITTPQKPRNFKPEYILFSYDATRNEIRMTENIGAFQLVRALRLAEGLERDRAFIRSGQTTQEFAFSSDSNGPGTNKPREAGDVVAIDSISSPSSPSSLLFLRGLNRSQGQFELERHAIEGEERSNLWKKAITLNQLFKPLRLRQYDDSRIYLMGDLAEASGKSSTASIYRFTSLGELDTKFGRDNTGQIILPPAVAGQTSKPLYVHVGPKGSALRKLGSVVSHGGATTPPKILIYDLISTRLLGERLAPSGAQSLTPIASDEYDESAQALYTLWGTKDGATITKTCLNGINSLGEKTSTSGDATSTADEQSENTPRSTTTSPATNSPTDPQTSPTKPPSALSNESVEGATTSAQTTATSTQTSTTQRTVEQYQVLELTFNSTIDYWETTTNQREVTVKDPFDYYNNRVYLELTPPGSTTPLPKGFLGFWNGGTEWKVRVSFDQEGTWRYTLRNTMGDRSLEGVSGTVNVVEPTGHDRTAKQGGIIKMDPNRKQLVYQNGNPFFHLGDRWSRFPKGFDKEGYTCGKTPRTFRCTFLDKIIEERKEQGFTVIQANSLHWKFKLPDPDNIFEKDDRYSAFRAVEARAAKVRAAKESESTNPSSWVLSDAEKTDFKRYWNYFDERLKKLTDAGFVVSLGFGSLSTIDKLIGDEDPNADENKAVLKQMFHYVLARYGAYPITFWITQEYNTINKPNYDTGEITHLPEAQYTRRTDLINEIGSTLAQFDPYGRALAVHLPPITQFTVTDINAQQKYGSLYNPAENWPWVSFYMAQIAHWKGIVPPGLSDKTKRPTSTSYRDRDMGLPTFSPALYDKFFDPKANTKSLLTKPWIDTDVNWDQFLKAYEYDIDYTQTPPVMRMKPTPVALTRFPCETWTADYAGGPNDITMGWDIHGESNAIAYQAGSIGLSYGVQGLYGSSESVADYDEIVINGVKQGKYESKWGRCVTMYDALRSPTPDALKILKDAYTKHLRWWLLKPELPAILNADKSLVDTKLTKEDTPPLVPSRELDSWRNTDPEDGEVYRFYLPEGFYRPDGSSVLHDTQQVKVQMHNVKYRLSVYCSESPREDHILLSSGPKEPPEQPVVHLRDVLKKTIGTSKPCTIELVREDHYVKGHRTPHPTLSDEEHLVHFPSFSPRGGFAYIDVKRANTPYVYYGISTRSGCPWIRPQQVNSSASSKVKVLRPPTSSTEDPSRPYRHFLMVIKEELSSRTTRCSQNAMRNEENE